MNKEEINKVEEYIKSNSPEGIKIISLITQLNPNKASKAAKYLTTAVIEDEKTSLQGTSVFNSLKLLRELNKKEKYGKIKENI